MLPWEDHDDIRAREIAAQIVLTSAEAAWENRLQIEGQPLFGADWGKQARLPGLGRNIAAFTGGRCVRPTSPNATSPSSWVAGC